MSIPSYRWKRLRIDGAYRYSCAAELERSPAIVYKELEGWFFSTKWGGVRGEKEIGARTCECCGTGFPGKVLGWKTYVEAKRAAEIYIEADG